MTEVSGIKALPPAIEAFVLQWGDMGDKWGVNRSVAQIHALLFLSDRPLTAEEIAEALGMARSNVSTSIRELLGWQLIRRVPVLGDRRDHFAAETDIQEMVRRIVQGRKEREIDPALAALRSSVAAAQSDRRISPVALQRLADMLAFVEAINRFYEQMLGVPAAKLMALVRMGARLVTFLSAGRGGSAKRSRTAELRRADRLALD